MSNLAEKLFTSPEVAELIGCKEHTLRSWIRAGAITPTEITGKAGTAQARYFFDMEAVDAARAIHEEGGRAEAAKQAMNHVSEEVLTKLDAASNHVKLEGEIIVVSGSTVIRVEPRETVREMLARLGPGNFICLR